MSWGRLLLLEIRTILTNPTIFLTVVGGMIFYSFLYPQPYLHQIPRKQKIAVLDNDNTPMSRRLIRMVSATPQVDICVQVGSRSEAKHLLSSKEISGLLLVPKNFHRDVLQHRSPTLVYAGDASYFLVYGTIIEGITKAATALDAEIKLEHQSQPGKPANPPLRLNARPVFNPNTGYLNYVIPAVFILILQQTLLIGAGIHGTTLEELHRAGKTTYCTDVSPLYLLTTRLAAFTLIYTPFVLFYFGFCFEKYQILRLANPSELASIIVPLLLATASLGAIIGKLVPRKELVTLVILVSSLPLVFSAGFVWPSSSIPFWINWLVQWVPSIHATHAIHQLNQMGADFTTVAGEQSALWGLFGLYFSGALLLHRKKEKTVPVRATQQQRSLSHN
ncbi:MAG: ABC transporter [Deltaproteobacteria bacterium]|nr:MAG: ABC transporter [Deltaproteobacteria bacterium]